MSTSSSSRSAAQTVGDIESLPFLEAIRQFRQDVGRHNTLYIHLTLVPFIGTAGKLKTKPTHHSVRDFRSIGIQSDILLCRTDRFLDRDIKQKIALFCDVDEEAVSTAKDVSDADVARGHSREHCALKHVLAVHRLPRRHHGQAPGGRNAERMHRLADDVFPQHGPERGPPITATGERRLPCPFQLNVQAIAGRRDLLAEQDRAAVAESGEVAELVTGIRLTDRSTPFGQGIAGEDRGPVGTIERLRLESKHGRQGPVERDQARLANRRWRRMRVEELRQIRIRVLEAPACHGDHHTQLR